MGWLVPYSSLTPEQQQAVMLPLEGHRVIVGGPGAGDGLARVVVGAAHGALGADGQGDSELGG